MPSIQIESLVQAPRELCFDLARDIDLHVRSTSHTKEKPVAGVTSGSIGMGEEVTWEATHFFVRQQLTLHITAFRRPEHFGDTQIRGAFRRFDHDHFFTPLERRALAWWTISITRHRSDGWDS